MASQTHPLPTSNRIGVHESGEHTPGPWVAQTHPEGAGPDAVYTTAGIKVAYCMAMFGRPHVKREEWNANARLISAAPDLLDALSDFMVNPAFQVAVGGNPNAVEAMMERARTAIAKARGDA
jgi:hypothetical protein